MNNRIALHAVDSHVITANAFLAAGNAMTRRIAWVEKMN